MNSIQVSVAEVAWWAGDDDGESGLVVYAPAGVLPAAPLDGAPAESVAGGLVRRHQPGALGEVEWQVKLESTTFLAGDEETTLLYTVAVPASASLVSSRGEATDGARHDDWYRLDEPPAGAEAAFLALREYWRQLLEETTAAFDLLPRYFTTTQMRSMYDSVWGGEQDAGNFHRWVHKQNDGICRKADAATITHERDQTADRVWKNLDVPAKLTLDLLTPGLVGTSPTVLKGGAAAVFPGVVLGAAVAAGAVAYQAGKQRGPQPQWYTRTDPTRVVLAVVYPPRPTWMAAGLQTA